MLEQWSLVLQECYDVANTLNLNDPTLQNLFPEYRCNSCYEQSLNLRETTQLRWYGPEVGAILFAPVLEWLDLSIAHGIALLGSVHLRCKFLFPTAVSLPC